MTQHDPSLTPGLVPVLMIKELTELTVSLVRLWRNGLLFTRIIKDQLIFIVYKNLVG